MTRLQPTGVDDNQLLAVSRDVMLPCVSTRSPIKAGGRIGRGRIEIGLRLLR